MRVGSSHLIFPQTQDEIKMAHTDTLAVPTYNGQRSVNNGKTRISLLLGSQTTQTLREMVNRNEAEDVPDAIRRIMNLGLQVQDMYVDGYTQVIFQNPDERLAVGVDLRKNLG